jgi:hypothetical protein
MHVVRGLLESIEFNPSRPDMVTVHILDQGNSVTLDGVNADLFCDGQKRRLAELLVWLLDNTRQVAVSLYENSGRYGIALKAEFVREP